MDMKKISWDLTLFIRDSYFEIRKEAAIVPQWYYPVR